MCSKFLADLVLLSQDAFHINRIKVFATERILAQCVVSADVHHKTFTCSEGHDHYPFERTSESA